MALARIGVGANLGDAPQTVRDAFVALERFGRVVRASSLYRTKPWGIHDQLDFVNAAVLLDTDLGPRELLAALKTLELEFGRTPTLRWGPRELDLDILTYDDLAMSEPDLIIPHPHLYERSFALVPLAEIDQAFEAALAALPQDDRATVERLEG